MDLDAILPMMLAERGSSFATSEQYDGAASSFDSAARGHPLRGARTTCGSERFR